MQWFVSIFDFTNFLGFDIRLDKWANSCSACSTPVCTSIGFLSSHLDTKGDSMDSVNKPKCSSLSMSKQLIEPNLGSSSVICLLRLSAIVDVTHVAPVVHTLKETFSA